MTKFKVGDKVRILDVESIDFGRKFWLNGDVTKVTDVEVDGGVYLATPCSKGRGLYVTKAELRYIDLVPHSSTKNQRITTLESEVAELKAKVEALENAQSKPKYTLDGLLSQVKPSPNERRKAIIAEAKAFVEDSLERVKDRNGDYQLPNGNYVRFDYHVNAKKRTVVVVAKAWHDGDFRGRWIAKCAPDDVFNADIGKAIALGRALGLDVSKFEQAVKPTEVVVGHAILGTNIHGKHFVYNSVDKVENGKIWQGNSFCRVDGEKEIGGLVKNPVILDDTEAQY